MKESAHPHHRLDVLAQIFITLSVLQVSLETLPSFAQRYQNYWDVLEWFFFSIFSMEYIIRLRLAQNKIKFALSFYGIIDILAILPTVLAFGILDLRIIRSFRLLRVVRILKLARYSKALDRFKAAFLEVKEELIIFFFLSLILLYVTASGIYYFENRVQPHIFKSIPHSLWWAVATLTTVGYGDAYPVTTGGKVFTFFILMIGLGIISIPSGLLASSFSRAGGEKNGDHAPRNHLNH